MKREEIQSQIIKIKADIDFIPFKKKEYEIDKRIKIDKLKTEETTSYDFQLKSDKLSEEKITKLNNDLKTKLKELDIELINDVDTNNKILDDSLILLNNQLKDLEKQLKELPEVELPDSLNIKSY